MKDDESAMLRFPPEQRNAQVLVRSRLLKSFDDAILESEVQTPQPSFLAVPFVCRRRSFKRLSLPISADLQRSLKLNCATRDRFMEAGASESKIPQKYHHAINDVCSILFHACLRKKPIFTRKEKTTRRLKVKRQKIHASTL